MSEPSLTNELEFSTRIKSLPDRELMEFTALQVYSIHYTITDHHRRIKRLENRSYKTTGAVGGISAIIGVVIASVIDYFTRR